MSDAMTAAPGHVADAAGISRVRSQGGIVTHGCATPHLDLRYFSDPSLRLGKSLP